ncbi:fasciclin domain-containing protein [Falsiroseomonas tokyonensis]|uniref:Fasciclin domain-containing protein n=1 Tax=Falsiroseomonas tokyonensis TaxID=430521 RepID=A0ABV7C2W3_9PROT|nr:fasciclin domain-containing protein [Falsiroseomonas tokyonensis]MBU8540639.1 fasciclin domain-containing protein [Falsiroseomonas tokyonensis]
MTRLRRLIIGAAAGLASAALAPAGAQAASLFETVAANPRLSTFASLIRKAGLESQLGSQAGVTLYAPTNAAFEALPYAAYRRLTETSGQAEAAAVVRAHMVSWSSPIPMDTDGSAVMTTLGGTQLAFQGISSSTVRVNGRPILQMNIRADNGFLHIVSDVLPTP